MSTHKVINLVQNRYYVTECVKKKIWDFSFLKVTKFTL